MYTHLTVSVHQQIAVDRRRDLLAAADRHRLVRRQRDSHTIRPASGRRPGRAAADLTRTAHAGSSLLPVGSFATAVRVGRAASAAAPATPPGAAATPSRSGDRLAA